MLSKAMSAAIQYRKSHPLPRPWHIEGAKKCEYYGAIIIPALAEAATLAATLDSLAQNPAELLTRFVVVVVVNHREDASVVDKENNLHVLEQLRSGGLARPNLNLVWVDAASPDLELPLKDGGVGMARKIGHDLSLHLFDLESGDPLMISLDADTLVGPDYLPALVRHFETSRAGAAIVPFRHQPATTVEGNAAIQRYELFLRCYVLGLKQAGSPYGFHTVGSAMACRVSAYLKIGGMNSRQAGEDFYFLQQLSRTVGVEQVSGTVIFPSARSSHRVPFGTGRSVGRLLGGEADAVSFYRVECYQQLGEWLGLVASGTDMDGQALRDRSGDIFASLQEYLDTIGFVTAWDNLKRNNRTPEKLLRAFHGWFDGLRTMKLIHHLSAGPFPRCEPQEAVEPLFVWAGLEPVEGVEGQLEVLRVVQNQ